MSHCLNLLFKDFFSSHPLPPAEPTASYLVSSAALCLALQPLLQTHFKKPFHGGSFSSSLPSPPLKNPVHLSSGPGSISCLQYEVGKKKSLDHCVPRFPLL